MYGLSAMTGVLPTIVVAGAATQMARGLFNQSPRQGYQRSPKQYSQRPVRRPVRRGTGVGLGYPSFGNFGNVGF